MTPYQFGVQRALTDAGLVKQAAGLGWPLAAGGAALLGAGAGAIGSEDKKRGAMIGALGGLGAVGGARYGTGKLTKFLRNVVNTEKVRGLAPAAHLKRILGSKGVDVRHWVNKHVGSGAALGLGGLGAGIGLGSRIVPHSEGSSGDSGGLLGLTPQRASQLQDLLPVVQQLYQASQGQAPLPSLAAYATPSEKMSSLAGSLVRSIAKNEAMQETRELMGVETPKWKPGIAEEAESLVEKLTGQEGAAPKT